VKKPKVLIFSGYGLNCEEEAKFAFETAGATADIIHINDLIKNKKLIHQYQMLTFPGGFAYGDDTGSGNAYGQKVKNHLWHEIEKFISGDHLVIGICNGFQIIVNLGLLPAIKFNYGSRQIALLHNESARYVDRWVDLKNESSSPWLSGIDTFTCPIAHGEGKLYADSKTLAYLSKKKLIALRYIKGEICKYQSLPANPTGTLEDIAGITDESGKILGLMPHAERAMFFTQLPHWPLLKEKYKREGKQIPTYGPGLQLFKNSVGYFA
jgi:phosphoribosylformylglycinamidine synthase